MKNRISWVACAALALWTSGVSAQAERGFFAEVNIGTSETSFRPAPVATIDDRDVSFDVGIGYAFGPHFAVSAAWHDFGEVTGLAHCPPEGCTLEEGECPPGFICVVFAPPVPAPVDVSGWSARLTGTLPLPRDFSAFASIGIMGWDTSAPTVTTLPGIGPVDDLDDSGEDLVYAAGMRWHVSDRWSLQVLFERVELDIESGKLGATYRF